MNNRTDDRRLVMRVLSRWCDMAGGRGLPRRSQIDPRHFGQDWASCLLIDLDPEPRESRFAFVGDSLRDPLGPPFERQRIAECVDHTLLQSTIDHLDRVLADGERLNEGVGTHLGAAVLYRSILLPLSEDGRRIDGALGAANCRDI